MKQDLLRFSIAQSLAEYWEIFELWILTLTVRDTRLVVPYRQCYLVT